ncbi:MAG TPA: M3 family metallopeptidase [Nevskiaceae bacterium]|nr:M3 family metallopeptidase [Nevskiaceae bacterium]
MTPLLRLSLGCCLALSAAACATPGTAPETAATAAPSRDPLAGNPFAQPSRLPYQLPPFDQIRPEHFLPAFEAGMAEQLREVAAITGQSAAPTVDNTLIPLQKSGALLDRVASVFFNLTGAHTNPELEQIQATVAPLLSAHGDRIGLDPLLYARVKAIYEQRASLGLDAETLRLVERSHENFVRAGARLDAAQKEQLKALNLKLSTLTTRFQQNVLKEVNASAVLVSDRAELEGLSDNAIAAAAEAAKAAGKTGYLLALQNTSGQPPLASLKNRALRQRLYEASIGRGSRGGEFDNRALIIEIAQLRAQRAALLGYPTHAAYGLEDQTARTPEAVNSLLARLAPAAVANARREAADMQKLLSRDLKGATLQPWDWAYYAEKVRAQRYAYDESQLRPYFELNRVLVDGAFFMAKGLYGLSFKERPDLPVYHPDVRVFEVFEDDGRTLGLFLFDPFARPSKRGGAWMNSYVDQSALTGNQPVVGNHLNIPKPPAGEPVLLTFDEANTLFHEFGHAVHGLFSNVRYPQFSGTSVPRDFVEYPSQVHEMWTLWPQVLANYAKHYQTGAPMPQALVDKVLAADQFNQGFATTEYLAAALLDQAWHQIAPGTVIEDALAFEAAALKKAGVDYALVPPRYRSTYFSHIFAGGYSAGYYAYIWSEVLDAESVQWFKENGGFTRPNGQWFRERLLSRGGSVDAMTLFKSFRGREPSIEPLLERRGLK